MKLIIESFSLSDDVIKKNYKDMMDEINAKDISNFQDKLNDLFLHEVEFNKDLNVSEIMKIKKILERENCIFSTSLEDNNGEKITLFSKRG